MIMTMMAEFNKENSTGKKKMASFCLLAHINGLVEQGEGGWGPVWRNSTKLPPLSKDTLTERHAQPGFDPGFTDWVPTLLATDPSEAGIKVECSHRTTWYSPPIPIILIAVVLLHTTRG